MSEWILGKHAVTEAIKSGRDMEKVLFAEGAKVHSIQEECQKRRIPFQRVPRSKLDQLAEGENHQGVMAQVSSYHYVSVEEILDRANRLGEMPFLLLLDGIEDPHNLGSILRTADAAGVHGVIIPKRRAVGLTAAVAKTSAGAIEYVPVARVSNLNRVADELKKQGIWLIGTAGEAKDEYSKIDYRIPLALVIGNEGQGISTLLRKKCDFLVKLPMKGKVSSLNASVATGIFLYEVMRGRKIDD